MYNDIPPLLDPLDASDVDPVTGARRIRRSSFNYNRNRNSGSFFGVPVPVPVAHGFVPPYGYASEGYTTSPYLTPTTLPSPQLVPAAWVNAYYDLYGQRPPASLNDQYAPSPRRRTVQLPSPNISPYRRFVSLPVLPDEPEYQDPRETWATRFKNWITGENGVYGSRQINQDIRVNGCFYKRDSDITWHVAFPPHSMRLRFPVDNNTSAFDPPLITCRIVSKLLPWVIEVNAFEGQPFITVLGLVASIYDFLKGPIDRGAYDTLKPSFRELVDQAYHRRCRSIPDEEMMLDALDRGIRKVDFLVDDVYFAGLSQMKGMYQTFELKLDTRP